MKITDLMDDYYDERTCLSAAEHPTAARIRELTLNKLGIEKRTHRRVPVGALAASACVVVFSITAGAVGYSLWDAAREDVGLSIGADIPEYVEYQNDEKTQAELSFSETVRAEEAIVDGAELTLISTLCAGEDVTAYVSVSPVSQEMADGSWEDAQELDVFTTWEASVDPTDLGDQSGSHGGARQVEYDPETETALLRLEFHGKCFAETTGFTVGMSWFYQAGDYIECKDYGAVRIPVTPSEELAFTPNAALENDYLQGETATITELCVGASFVSVSYQIKSLETLCAEYGENAYFIIGDAYEGYYAEQSGNPRRSEYSALDATVYYGRSWSASLRTRMEDAYLTMKDGSSVSLGGLLETGQEDTDTTRTERFELNGAIDLSQVDSITLNGETYPVK